MGVLSTEPLLYLTISKGWLVNKKKKIETRGYEGTLIGIEEKPDEYEGKPVMKVRLKMKDTKTAEIAAIEFTQESWFSLGFFARIEKVDITKPFTLGVSPSEKNEKMSFCWIGQKGLKNAKTGKETAEGDPNFPKPEEKVIGRTKVQDWSKPLERMLPIIEALQAKLGTGPLFPEEKSAEHSSGPPSPFGNETLVPTPDDDLPF